MESQPQNPEFRINPENFHPCVQHAIDVNSLYVESFSCFCCRLQ